MRGSGDGWAIAAPRVARGKNLPFHGCPNMVVEEVPLNWTSSRRLGADARLDVPLSRYPHAAAGAARDTAPPPLDPRVLSRVLLDPEQEREDEEEARGGDERIEWPNRDWLLDPKCRGGAKAGDAG